MKNWHKILAVALLIAGAGLTGHQAKTEASSPQEEQAETAPISEAALPVVLPERAEVILREGVPKEGQLSEVTDEQLVLALAGLEISVPIKDVTEVKFKGDVRFYSNGQLVIRGEGELESKPEVWSQIPLSAFQVVEAATGQARVNLTQSSLPEAKQQGIVTVATTAAYMVEKMQFEPEGKVTLTVKPIIARE
jgi:hypothetical protein